MPVIYLLIAVLLFAGAAPLAAAVASPVQNEDAFLMDVLWNRYRRLGPEHEVKIGLALGGGGARGLAHIGVLKAFEEEDVPIGALAGTSVGALIGGLYAAGITTGQLEQMTQEIGWSSLTNYSRYTLMRLVLTESQLSNERMGAYLRKHIGDTRFDELKIPFACVATDLQTGESVIFREGPVAIAARASATIPGLFTPVEFRHRYLVDGGLVTNLPLNLLGLMNTSLAVAVDVTSDIEQTKPKSVLGVMNQSISILSQRLAKDESSRADIMIRPQMGNIGLMDLGRSDEAIDAGILAGRKAIPSIKRLIIDRRFEQIARRRKKS
jgi:NTE family protein